MSSEQNSCGLRAAVSTGRRPRADSAPRCDVGVAAIPLAGRPHNFARSL
jgi:hypothetical protein